MNQTKKTYLQMFARLLLALGGVNYLLKLYKIDLLSYYPSLTNIFSLLIGLSGLYFLFNRDYYLPFLGECAFPLTQNTPQNNLTSIKLSNLPPNTTIIAWGAQKSNNTFDNPFDAYGNYENTVIAKSNQIGEAIVNLHCPAEYSINNFGIVKKINKHIHYRFELPSYKGLFSRVFTKELDEKCQ